ncbi:MAG: adenylate/guanylate cyclase domain-containing protein [Actinomycetota bacterium]
MPRSIVHLGVVWLAVTTIAIAGWRAGAFASFDERGWDRLQPVVEADDETVVIAIDRSAIRAGGGAWPWPRERHAELVDTIADAGAEGIVYDVVFVDERPGDDALAAALSRLPAALATELGGVEAVDGSFAAATRTGPNPTLTAGPIEGHTSHRESTRDGITREIPLTITTADGRVVPALGLTAEMIRQGVEAPIMRDGAVQVGATSFATDAGAVRLARSGGLEIVSAQSVLERRIDPDVVAGRVVFVGVTEPTIAEEIAVGGGEPAISGTELHAELANQLRQGFVFRTASPALVGIWIAFLALVGVVAMVQWRLRIGALAIVGVGIAHLVVVVLRHERGVLVSMVWPLLALGFGAAASFVVRWFVTDREGRRVRSLFRSYVPAAVAESLLTSDTRDVSIPAAREVAVLFADLRGFTAQSAELTPPGVARWVEIFWEEMTAVVFEHEGTLISYAGDEVFAAWGAPLAVDAPGEHAVACALAMQERGDAMRRRQAAEGFPPARFGIGVHVGPAVAAHLGPPERRQYTLFGDVVNIGARLCSAAAPGEVVATSDAVGDLDGVETVVRAEQQFKGVAQKLDVRIVSRR